MRLKEATLLAAILTAIAFIAGVINIAVQFGDISFRQPIQIAYWFSVVLAQGGISLFFFVLYSKQ